MNGPTEAELPELYRQAGLVWPPQGPELVEIFHESCLTVDMLIAHLEWVRERYGGGVVVCVPRPEDGDRWGAVKRSTVADYISLLLWPT